MIRRRSSRCRTRRSRAGITGPPRCNTRPCLCAFAASLACGVHCRRDPPHHHIWVALHAMNTAPDPNRKSWGSQALMVVAALTALLWFLQVRRAPVQFLERRDCEKAYAAAHTHAD